MTKAIVSFHVNFYVTLLVWARDVGVAADIFGDLAKGNTVALEMHHSNPSFKKGLTSQVKGA